MPSAVEGGNAVAYVSGQTAAFKDIGGVAQGNVMTTTVQHFSSGFVGRAIPPRAGGEPYVKER